VNRRSDGFRVEALFPNFHNESGVSYTLKSILEAIATDTLEVGATVASTDVKNTYVHGVINRYLYKYLVPRFRSPMQSVFRSACRRLHAGDVAYFWLESPADECEYFRTRGILVVREMINCTLQLRRQELNKAYAALGARDPTECSDAMIEQQRRDLLAADLIFCPNPFVRKSVVEYGVPIERCIETSYGWSADRLGTDTRILTESRLFTAAFVGSIDVRKGVPTLLEAWARANIKGRLLLAGNLSPEVQRLYAPILRRSDVVQLGFVRDVGAVYRSADVFCFPTWEEGGPQVTLEAMACGAVPIVTPMGTAGVFSAADDVGIVISPGDIAALSDALCLLASDGQKLNQMKHRSRECANEYTWEKVGRRRREALVRFREQWLRNSSGQERHE